MHTENGSSWGQTHAPRNVADATRALFLRPFTYLVLYVVAIFTFAALYDWIDDAAFYAPYAKFEPSSADDTAMVEFRIVDIVSKADRLLRVDDTGWLVNPNSFGVTDLTLEEGGDFHFTMVFYGTHFTADKRDAVVSGPVPIRVSRRLIMLPKEKLFCRMVTWQQDKMRETILAELFRQSPLNPPMLCWDGRSEYQFHQMGSGWSGNPKAFSGSYWRMVYLSAVTITSVGYGDIVPMSSMARFLCGLEAVLGWVIAGFFLNAIAQRRASA